MQPPTPLQLVAVSIDAGRLPTTRPARPADWTVRLTSAPGDSPGALPRLATRLAHCVGRVTLALHRASGSDAVVSTAVAACQGSGGAVALRGVTVDEGDATSLSAGAIAEAIVGGQPVHHVVFHRCHGLASVGLAQLALALPFASHLAVIDVAGCAAVDDAACVSLARALVAILRSSEATTHPLRLLELSHTGITDAGVAVLSAAMFAVPPTALSSTSSAPASPRQEALVGAAAAAAAAGAGGARPSHDAASPAFLTSSAYDAPRARRRSFAGGGGRGRTAATGAAAHVPPPPPPPRRVLQLRLRGLGLTAAAAVTLSRVITSGVVHLELLDLEESRIGDEGASALAAACAAWAHRRGGEAARAGERSPFDAMTLSLRRCNLSASGIVSLAGAARVCHSSIAGHAASLHIDASFNAATALPAVLAAAASLHAHGSTSYVSVALQGWLSSRMTGLAATTGASGVGAGAGMFTASATVAIDGSSGSSSGSGHEGRSSGDGPLELALPGDLSHALAFTLSCARGGGGIDSHAPALPALNASLRPLVDAAALARVHALAPIGGAASPAPALQVDVAEPVLARLAAATRDSGGRRAVSASRRGSVSRGADDAGHAHAAVRRDVLGDRSMRDAFTAITRAAVELTGVPAQAAVTGGIALAPPSIAAIAAERSLMRVPGSPVLLGLTSRLASPSPRRPTPTSPRPQESSGGEAAPAAGGSRSSYTSRGGSGTTTPRVVAISLVDEAAGTHSPRDAAHELPAATAIVGGEHATPPPPPRRALHGPHTLQRQAGGPQRGTVPRSASIAHSRGSAAATAHTRSRTPSATTAGGSGGARSGPGAARPLGRVVGQPSVAPAGHRAAAGAGAGAGTGTRVPDLDMAAPLAARLSPQRAAATSSSSGGGGSDGAIALRAAAHERALATWRSSAAVTAPSTGRTPEPVVRLQPSFGVRLSEEQASIVDVFVAMMRHNADDGAAGGEAATAAPAPVPVPPATPARSDGSAVAAAAASKFLSPGSARIVGGIVADFYARGGRRPTGDAASILPSPPPALAGQRDRLPGAVSSTAPGARAAGTARAGSHPLPPRRGLPPPPLATASAPLPDDDAAAGGEPAPSTLAPMGPADAMLEAAGRQRALEAARQPSPSTSASGYGSWRGGDSEVGVDAAATAPGLPQHADVTATIAAEGQAVTAPVPAATLLSPLMPSYDEIAAHLPAATEAGSDGAIGTPAAMPPQAGRLQPVAASALSASRSPLAAATTMAMSPAASAAAPAVGAGTSPRIASSAALRASSIASPNRAASSPLAHRSPSSRDAHRASTRATPPATASQTAASTAPSPVAHGTAVTTAPLVDLQALLETARASLPLFAWRSAGRSPTPAPAAVAAPAATAAGPASPITIAAMQRAAGAGPSLRVVAAQEQARIVQQARSVLQGLLTGHDGDGVAGVAAEVRADAASARASTHPMVAAGRPGPSTPPPSMRAGLASGAVTPYPSLADVVMRHSHAPRHAVTQLDQSPPAAWGDGPSQHLWAAATQRHHQSTATYSIVAISHAGASSAAAADDDDELPGEAWPSEGDDGIIAARDAAGESVVARPWTRGRRRKAGGGAATPSELRAAVVAPAAGTQAHASPLPQPKGGRSSRGLLPWLSALTPADTLAAAPPTRVPLPAGEPQRTSAAHGAAVRDATGDEARAPSRGRGRSSPASARADVYELSQTEAVARAGSGSWQLSPTGRAGPPPSLSRIAQAVAGLPMVRELRPRRGGEHNGGAPRDEAAAAAGALPRAASRRAWSPQHRAAGTEGGTAGRTGAVWQQVREQTLPSPTAGDGASTTLKVTAVTNGSPARVMHGSRRPAAPFSPAPVTAPPAEALATWQARAAHGVALMEPPAKATRATMQAALAAVQGQLDDAVMRVQGAIMRAASLAAAKPARPAGPHSPSPSPPARRAAPLVPATAHDVSGMMNITHMLHPAAPAAMATAAAFHDATSSSSLLPLPPPVSRLGSPSRFYGGASASRPASPFVLSREARVQLGRGGPWRDALLLLLPPTALAPRIATLQLVVQLPGAAGGGGGGDATPLVDAPTHEVTLHPLPVSPAELAAAMAKPALSQALQRYAVRVFRTLLPDVLLCVPQAHTAALETALATAGVRVASLG